MRAFTMAVVAGLAVALFSVNTSADQPRESFVGSWKGKRLVIRRTLTTLVYNERSRRGTLHRNRRAGLTVASPLANPYLRFFGREPGHDIVARDPQELLDLIAVSYPRDEFGDGRVYPRVEPLMMVRYEPGGALIVKSVHVERDRVHLDFESADNGRPSGAVTALTIQWPIDLSPTLIEAPIIDALIRQFVDRPAAQ